MATKKPRGKQYWYRHKRKRIAKKPKASLLSLPAEVRFLIYGYVFVNQRMIDVATTEKGDYRRRYGGQSLLFVNKIIRKEASHAFYKTCIFEVPHFRLHKEHIGLNPMKNLDNIQNLYILWTVPNHAKFTSKTADDQMLEGLKNLKKLTLDLRGLQYILVDSGADEADLHSSLMEKFRPHFHNLPTWMKRLIRNHSERLTIYLVVHFFAAPIAAPTFFAVSSRKKISRAFLI